MSVKRVLDRICWQDFYKTGTFSDLYYQCMDAIKSIPSSPMTIIADRPFNWAREKATIIKVGNLWFLYKKYNSGIVTIEEVYDAKTNQILTEDKNRLIDSTIQPILEFQQRLDRI